MAYDELLLVEDVTTGQTLASAYNGSAKDLSQGSLRCAGPHWVRVAISAGNTTSSTANVVFQVDHSDTTTAADFTVCGGATETVVVNTTFAGMTNQTVFIPVVTDKRYIRITATKGATGTITTGLKWKAYLGNAQPQ